MVASPQIEQRLAFETRTAPVDPAAQGGTDAARTGNQPDFGGGATSSQPANGNESAFSVDISAEAQRITAGDTVRTDGPQTDAAEPGTGQDLDATVETSATAGEAPDDAGTTNQVTSFEGERTGNDTRNDTEAGRTLGQVIDTFA